MKWIYAVLFSFLSLAGILKDLAVYVSFKSNQEYIAITMCTGRFDPVNTCNGSCYLNNQLQLVHDFENDKDGQIPPNLKERITFFAEDIIEEIRPNFAIKEAVPAFFFACKTNSGYPSAIFQPPQNC